MTKYYKQFQKWANKNQGISAIIGIIIAIIAIIPKDLFKLSNTPSFTSKIYNLVTKSVNIPLYLAILLLGLVFLYVKSKINSLLNKSIDFDFLVGKWKCEWQNGSEISEITIDKKYNINSLEYR